MGYTVYVPPLKRQEMEKKYAMIRKAEEGEVAFTINLSQDEWRKIRAHAETAGITYQELVKQLIYKL